ncbi:peptidase associated/transthyretin-like domain-containing protein [Williamwhitmania taraxaci]|uniref:CarboxypepD_reg-like domain-containing protein n=1 Tax=Williamwhitmania taraxaci TaxID=1640674 RepID=A0A1G6GTH4_9BACT|nr:hypothetical protein [Williamwhitmania taraxaci]SDB85297.1 hypothetical protein SAMN05216323_10048 [Williamwhitmania taraxaci]
MKTIVITVLFCLLFLLSYSQENIKLTIVDDETKEPIEFATFAYFHANQCSGVYSDALGVVTITLPSTVDSIRISCMGYQPTTLTKIASKTIGLHRKTFNIKEVVVRPCINFKTLGYINNKKEVRIGAESGLECAVLVENETGLESPIKSLLFRFKQNEKTKTVIRIHLYSCNSNRMPDKELINENLVVYITPQNDGIIDYDISKFGITLPVNGVFVGMEWIGCTDGETEQIIKPKRILKTSIVFTSLNHQATYLRSELFNGIWDNRLLDSIVPLKKGKFLNAAFGLKIVE